MSLGTGSVTQPALPLELKMADCPLGEDCDLTLAYMMGAALTEHRHDPRTRIATAHQTYCERPGIYVRAYRTRQPPDATGLRICSDCTHGIRRSLIVTVDINVSYTF